MIWSSPPEVSIIILTKNGRRYIREVLDGIYSQVARWSFEVILIDSGSTDGTLEIAQGYPVCIHQIAPETFNHGETRNLGGRLAQPSAQYLVHLTQDATPLPGWLDNLVAPLAADPAVAGAFSRHVPRPDCNPILARQITVDWEQSGTPERVVKRIVDPADFELRKIHYIHFHDTSSCLRRAVWQCYPYPVVDFAEDARWAETVLRAGYTIIYEPDSTVLHSHSYSLLEHCRQNYDHSRGMSKLLVPATPGPHRAVRLVPTANAVAHAILRDWRSMWHARQLSPIGKLYWMAYSPLWHGAAGLGNWLGTARPAISDPAQRWLSRQGRLRRAKA